MVGDRPVVADRLVLIGVGIALGLHLVGQLVLFVLASVILSVVGIADDQAYFKPPIYPLLVIGMSQLAYLLPMWLVARKHDRAHLAHGVLLVAAITFLLNAACFGTIGVAFGVTDWL